MVTTKPNPNRLQITWYMLRGYHVILQYTYIVPIKSLVIVIVFLYDGNKKHFSCQSPTATRAFFIELNQEIVPLAKYVYLGSSLLCCQIIVLDKSLTAQ